MKYLAFEKSVGGVVFRRQNGNTMFLLLRYRSGQWDFPKGHIEEGETEEETLRREIMEETGITLVSIIPNSRRVVRYFYRAWGNEKKERISEKKGVYIFKKVAYYVLETVDSNVRVDFENKDYKWLPYAKALRHISNKGSERILKMANSLLQK